MSDSGESIQGAYLEMETKTTDREWRKTRNLKILALILGLILLIGLVLTAYVDHLLGRMNYVDPNATQPSLSQAEIDAILKAMEETVDPDSTLPVTNPEDVLLESYDGVGIGTEAHIVNILLIGADYQGSDVGRSDTTILVTFNTEEKTLTMTSFMRDMFVKIPGYAKNKMNAAYSLGGMSLIKKTLNENFGIYVDGVVEVDFSQFRKIIDLLGGVELELTAKEASWINKKMKGKSELTEGVQLLNGREALWYARNRNDAQGDFIRTGRQRNLLNTLLETYKDTDLATALGILEEILPMLTTDMTPKQIIDYATVLFPMLMECEIVSQRIPADGAYYMTKIHEMSVLVPDLEENVQFLRETLLGVTAETEPAA